MAVSENFELTDEVHPTHKHLRRIRATKDIPRHNVKAGDLGGWICNIENLQDEAWIDDEAMVLDWGVVVKDKAFIRDTVTLAGKTEVSDDAILMGDVRLYDSKACGSAMVSGNVLARMNTIFSGSCSVSGMSYLHISGSEITDHAYIKATGDLRNSKIHESSTLTGYIEYVRADIEETYHTLHVGPIGSENHTAMIFRTVDEKGVVGHKVHIGCWNGQIEELIEEVERRVNDEWDSYPQKDIDKWVRQYSALELLAKASINGWVEQEKK